MYMRHSSSSYRRSVDLANHSAKVVNGLLVVRVSETGSPTMNDASNMTAVSDSGLDEHEIEQMMRRIQGDADLKEKAAEMI